MKKVEHLLVILMEECAEVAKEASKALRFGLQDQYPAGGETNAERIVREYGDLAAAMQMLFQENALTWPSYTEVKERQDAKIAKVKKFLEYSDSVGRLDKTF
jgi:hypothetical protein